MQCKMCSNLSFKYGELACLFGGHGSHTLVLKLLNSPTAA